jgi:hypothetical protein
MPRCRIACRPKVPLTRTGVPRFAFGWSLASVALFACAIDNARADQRPPPVSFVGTDVISVNATSPTANAQFVVYVSDESNDPVTPNFSLVGDLPKNGGLAQVGATQPLVPGEVRKVVLRLTGMPTPWAGFLRLRSDLRAGAASQFRAIHIYEAVPTWPALGFVVLSSLVVATATTAILFRRLLRDRVSLWKQMGSPQWDFSRSWSSNIAVFAGVLSATLAAFSQVQTSHMPTIAYFICNIVFAVCLVGAPLLYNATQTLCESATALPLLRGKVLYFLLSFGLVMFAALGELVTLSVLIDDVLQHSPSHIRVAFALSFLLFSVLLSRYSYLSGLLAVKSQLAQSDPARNFDQPSTVSSWALP